MQLIRAAFRLILVGSLAVLLYASTLALAPRPLPFNLIKNLNVPTGGHGHLYTRMKEAATYGKVDILVVGSSLAYRGFDPRIFAAHNIRLFNLGSSNQTPLQSEILLQRHLDELDPRLVIFALQPISLSVDGLESTLDLLANGPLDKQTFDLAMHHEHIKTYNAAAFAAMKQALEGPPTIDEPVLKGTDTYVKGGFVEQRSGSNHKPLPSPLPSFVPRSDQEKALERCIAMIEVRGRKAMIVRTPVLTTYADPEFDNTFNARMKRFAPVIDMSKHELIQDPSYFYDGSHLNQQGVQVFNTILIQDIKMALSTEITSPVRQHSPTVVQTYRTRTH